MNRRNYIANYILQFLARGVNNNVKNNGGNYEVHFETLILLSLSSSYRLPMVSTLTNACFVYGILFL